MSLSIGLRVHIDITNFTLSIVIYFKNKLKSHGGVQVRPFNVRESTYTVKALRTDSCNGSLDFSRSDDRLILFAGQRN